MVSHSEGHFLLTSVKLHNLEFWYKAYCCQTSVEIFQNVEWCVVF